MVIMVIHLINWDLSPLTCTYDWNCTSFQNFPWRTPAAFPSAKIKLSINVDYSKGPSAGSAAGGSLGRKYRKLES